MSSTKPSGLFNHQYRVRPTTVDQKRVKISSSFLFVNRAVNY